MTKDNQPKAPPPKPNNPLRTPILGQDGMPPKLKKPKR